MQPSVAITEDLGLSQGQRERLAQIKAAVAYRSRPPVVVFFPPELKKQGPTPWYDDPAFHGFNPHNED